jgi:type I restriction enzyme S subunit
MARYLMALLLSEHFTSFAVSRCVRTGIPKINRAELSEYLIPIPSIKDQESICQEMELIDQGIACAREHNGDLQQVKFAVLNAIVGEPE